MRKAMPAAPSRRALPWSPWPTLAALVVVLSAVACGPLPRPFEQASPNALLADQRALAPLAVRPIVAAPGLAEAMVMALEQEDIAASTDTRGTNFLVLIGKVTNNGRNAYLVWQLAQANGNVIGETRQPWPVGPIDDVHQAKLARIAAGTVARLMRGEDSGATDIEAEPHVAVRPIKAPSGFDGDGLARAMERALGRQGMLVGMDNPDFSVLGSVRIIPGAGGRDVVEISWVVLNSSGAALGTASQGSPVEHERLLGPLAPLLREIADAGAEGVTEVIHKSMRRR
jgi:hypothetical protein